MSVRAKFYVNEKKVVVSAPNQEGMEYITLLPVINGSDENKEFYKWTPSGKMELGVMNPVAAAQFEVGKEYYIDFTPAN